MAYNDDQQEYPVPSKNNNKRESAEFLPRYFRTPANKKFLASTLDQFNSAGVVEKISSFVGRKDAKAAQLNDTYLPETNKNREDYQLEPYLIYKDNIGNVSYNKDYLDYLGALNVYRSNTSNHSLLNQQEFYAWDPHIDFDKFTNFREYFWLPNGPQEIPVRGQTKDIVSTYTVSLAEDDDNFSYVFTPDGKIKNPSIKLYRGQTYRFEIDTPGQPFSIALSRSFKPGLSILDSSIVSTLYEEGVVITPDDQETLVERTDFIQDGFVERGVIEFTVPFNAPDTLYYISQFNLDTSGIFQIYNVEESSFIDIEKEIIGKKTYKTAAGWDFSNGMKVYFIGQVIPELYSTGLYYVEGVGSAIELIPINDLEVPTIFTQNTLIPFDTNGFDRVPFSDARSFAGSKDYVVMKRNDVSRNAWSRYNRWFHKSVIEQSAAINNQPVELDQDLRAKRPIIEFDAGLKLYNHGSKAKQNVDLVDVFTNDVFSIIEGNVGYNIDGIDIIDGMRILFTGDKDSFVYGKIFEVNFINHNNSTQISLIETVDSNPLTNETVLVTNGNEYSGKMFWFNGTEWLSAQDKTGLNQAPRFDLFDENENSIGDLNIYTTSSFTGNRIFSYKVGEGSNDNELGFPLTYKNIENIGDITFDFDLLNKTYSYEDSGVSKTINSDVCYLKKYDSINETFSYVNSWTKTNVKSRQYVVRKYSGADSVNNFPIDVYNNSATLNDLFVKVYLNNKLLQNQIDYDFVNINNTRFVVLESDIDQNDILIIKTYSLATKNQNGYYEIPYNFERNPLNNNITELTLGQVNDHVEGIVSELSTFVGLQPGINNLRDLGNIKLFGRKFVQHSGPLNLALYHLTDNDSNIVNSIRFVKNEYSKFKKVFLQLADTLGFDGPTKIHVDKILEEYSKDKTDAMPFYNGDMVGKGAAKILKYTILDFRNKFYALSQPFITNQLSIKAVNVYLNGTQLVLNRDYVFNTDGFVEIKSELQNGQLLEIYEYETTEGGFVPPTPTKLGIYPAYQPEIFVDTSYATPTTVIRGHDGSLTVAYNDFRDDLILELEKRIYNNIKVSYDETIFDIYNYLEGDHRNVNLNRKNLDRIMITDFVNWVKILGNTDYTDNSFNTIGSSFTYNYSASLSPTNKPLPGFWRAVYKQAYDTDRPHSHPWEMLGFSNKPTWWESVYGPAPYTSDNLILWKDLQDGVVREPNKKIKRLKKFVRPGLINHIPSDEYGRLLSPLDSGYAREFSYVVTKDTLFKFGDEAPTETAWRRSSEYPFSLITAILLNRPAEIFGLLYDRSRIKKDKTGNYVYSETNKRLRFEDLVFPKTKVADKNILTGGLVNFISAYFTSNINSKYENYISTLKSLQNQIGFKLGGYADKDKLKLVLDSRTPANKGNVFVPFENYNLVFRSSSPLETVSYSGVIIEKTSSGYKVNGYDRENPYFNYFKYKQTDVDPVFNIGGISESFIDWAENKIYIAGKIVRYNSRFYRTIENHTSSFTFDETKFTALKQLPIMGGVNAIFRRRFENTASILDYGTVFANAQDVIDFLLGYEKYLQSIGFNFDFVNRQTESVENFTLCAKEFLFWTTQNWASGTILTISPAANQVIFKKDYYVVEDIFKDSYNYPVLNANGLPLGSNFANIFRNSDNDFNLAPLNTVDGVYFIKLLLIQKEHVILIDNETVFNDTIYSPEAGYRQERLKVVGYRTDNWNGSLNIPGFVYDEAKIEDWVQWKDYQIGNIVKYKEFYYSARFKHAGKSVFDPTDWNRLSEKPVSSLKPNWDYRVNQFADFYDLDSDNFDSEQQRLAQHLIGYQKREYLANIIQDDVSQYKFYQGFIQDKGTNNSLIKLFDKLSTSNSDSLEFFEEWAIRVGQYGNLDTFEEVEYQLEESKFRLEPQTFELVNAVDQSRTDLVYQYPIKDLYIKPDDYDNNPFPINTNLIEYSKTGGYVKLDQINFIAKTLDDVLALDINAVNIGNYIWVPQYKQTWNVYKHIVSPVRITKIVRTDTGFIATFDKPIPFENEEIIGINNVSEEVNGFRVVKNKTVYTAEFLLNEPISDNEIDLSDSTLGIISQLNSRRFNTLADVNAVLKKYDLTNNDRIWVDNNNLGKFEVLDNSFVYTEVKEIANPEDLTLNGFGNSFASNDSNTILIVGLPDKGTHGAIQVYTRNSDRNDYKALEIITPSVSYYDAGAKFGTSVSLTPDGSYLFVGAPLASNVLTRYKGAFQAIGPYNEGDIVNDRGVLWQAAVNSPDDSSTINLDSQDWNAIDRIPIDVLGTPSGLSDQGVIHVYKRRVDGTYREIDAFVSPIPAANEKFGLSIKNAYLNSARYKLFVRAEGNNGRIYLFDSSADLNTYSFSRDRNYKGTWNVFSNYVSSEIVYWEGILYRATTAIFSGGLPPTTPDWEQVDSQIDYVGYIPNFGDILLDNSDSLGLGNALDIGGSFDVNRNGEVFILSGFLPLTNEFRISVYRLIDNRYAYVENIDSVVANEGFAYSIAINDSGTKVAVGALFSDENGNDNGKVYIYKQNNSGIFALNQELYSPDGEKNELFGYSVDFSNNKLAVFSINGDNESETIFDNGETIFDNNATKIIDTTKNNGQVYIFEDINDVLIYAEKMRNLKDVSDAVLPKMLLNRNHIIISYPYSLATPTSRGIINDYRSNTNAKAWTQNSVGIDTVDVTKIKGVFLYNKVNSDIVQFLDYIDPIQGKISGTAEQEINYKLNYDPAVYNVGSTNTGNKTVWNSDHVGKLWWDLSTAKWYNPYQGNTEYRSNNWNKLIPGFSVDVYEWVESDLLPSEWDDIADTTDGLSSGISGTSKYGDITYSQAVVYDSVAQTFTRRYFYWVKNKKIIPAFTNRKLNAQEVANLIANPAGTGYRYATLLGSDRFALHNCSSQIEDSNTILHFEYELFDNIEETNIHTEYQLLTEGLASSKPNFDVINKWFDSLVGYDKNNNQLPDLTVPIKQRFGILNYPNQSMFVNKTEALKQVIERVNGVLEKNLIVDEYDISPLFKIDPQPSAYLRKWDAKIENENLLRFVGVARVDTATLEPLIVDGKIVSINITNTGRGYIDPIFNLGLTTTRLGPEVEIIGSGSGAKIQLYINNLGQVTTAEVVKQGKNYLSDTTLQVRPFSVLVENDSTIGGFWAVYNYNKTAREWQRVYNQSYDVNSYWSYKDWYANGYNELTPIDFLVPGSYALDGLNNNIGSRVKIENVGTGGWLLLEKIDNQLNVDYTVNYKTIGRENGTLQFSELLYNNNLTGFDKPFYDLTLYDREPVDETRIILETIRDNIFVDQLEVEWNKLFFASVRYALAEQNNIDWIFKTSFVKAKHNVGELSQKITFKNDNLENYQDYVEEVKPYKSKIREYVSSYEGLDLTKSSVTDFDLPPRYDFIKRQIVGEEIKFRNNEITNINSTTLIYPQKYWYDNVGFEIIGFSIYNGGSGWTDGPIVTVSGGGGPTLTGKATLAGDTINFIDVDTNGAKYLSAPNVAFNGTQTANGSPAKVTAILGNSRVRSSHILMKFDRITGNYLFTTLDETETFTGNGGLEDFELKWPMDTKTSSTTVFVDGIQKLSSEFTISNVLDTSKGFSRYKGKISFVNPPALNSAIQINYKKSINLLHAADRINFFYNPTTGMLGKDLAQLMDGIDYGGVEVTGIDFGAEQGFDTTGFGDNAWDSFDTNYQDEIFNLDGSTLSLELSQPLEAGVVYNFYKNGVRLDDPNFDGSSITLNPNAVIASIIGDGITNIIEIDNDAIPTADGDQIVIRKSTSDGSFTPSGRSLDVELAGGNFEYTTARGITAGEIIVDGDGFVTPTTSRGPEELVPGQIVDTVDIQVYSKSRDGQGIITSHNYITGIDEYEWQINALPQSQNSVIVKLNNTVLDPSVYTIDYENNKLVITDSTAISAGQHLSIIIIGNNGENILDSDLFIADGIKKEYITAIPYKNDISAFVTVNGIIQTNQYLLENVNNSVAIKFSYVVDAGNIINYTIYDTVEQKYSQIVIDDTFIADGIKTQHKFATDTNTIPIPFNEKPISHKILVYRNGNFLSPGYNIKYVVTSARAYEIQAWQFDNINEIRQTDVLVYINGEQLNYSQYSWDPVNGRVDLVSTGVGLAGDELEIFVIKDADYYFTDTIINFNAVDTITYNRNDVITFALTNDSTVVIAKVEEFTNNSGDITIRLQGYVRELAQLASIDNSCRLDDSTAITINYVRYISSDYLTLAEAPTAGSDVKFYLFSNHDINQFERITYDVYYQSNYAAPGTQNYIDKNKLSKGLIELRQPAIGAQYVWVIKNQELLSPEIDYILTESLNHIQLVQKVFTGDKVDIVQFAAPVSVPKYGYRIFKDMLNRYHYKRFNKDNEYTLAENLNYYDINIVLVDSTGITEPNKNTGQPGIIWINGERIEYYVKEGNLLKQLRRGTLGTGVVLQHSRGSVVFGQGPEETIPYKDETFTTVFTGDGSTKDFVLDFTPNSVNEFEVFVAGRRLRKNAINIFDVTKNQDSPEADVTVVAEFSIEDNILRLTDIPGDGHRILVIRRFGKSWNDIGKSLAESNNQIARFIKDKTISLAR